MDRIIRGMIGNAARVFVASTKDTVQKAFEIHHTSPVMTAALGRTLTAGAMMGCMLKSESDLLTVTIKGDGPGKGITVTADPKARVKGYPYEPVVDIPLKPNGKLDVQAAMGFGTLTVIKDMGLKEPYVGQIPLVSGEIAEDITYYFTKSEQTPSAVALGVLVDKDYSVKQAGGFIIQMLPGAEEALISVLEKKISDMENVTAMLDKGMSCEDIFEHICKDLEHTVLDTIPVEYYCNCSRERVEKALISIGRKEIKDILETDGQANLHCHFCGKDYLFDRNDLERILAR